MAYFKKKRLNEITRFTVEHYRRHRQGGVTCRGKARSLATIDREVQLLSRIFSLAAEKNLITGNPCSGIKLLAPNVGAPRYLTREDEEKLRPHLTGRRAHLLDILDINLFTGMRRGEILTLTTSQIDFVRASIEITGKGNKKRSIPIHPDLSPILRRLCDKAGSSGYLFENPKTGRPLADIKTSWRAALRAAGIDHLPFHCAGRHTFATRAVDGGAPITAVSAVLGHSDVKTTMRYAHATDEGRRRVVEAAANTPSKLLEFRNSGTKVVQETNAAAKDAAANG
jgi:integrase